MDNADLEADAGGAEHSGVCGLLSLFRFGEYGHACNMFLIPLFTLLFSSSLTTPRVRSDKIITSIILTVYIHCCCWTNQNHFHWCSHGISNAILFIVEVEMAFALNLHYSFTFQWCFFSQGVRWTPSKMIHRLGKEINNPESVCYWAYKVSDLRAAAVVASLGIIIVLCCYWALTCNFRITSRCSARPWQMALSETCSTSSQLRILVLYWT